MQLISIEIEYGELVLALDPPPFDHDPLSMSFDTYSQPPWLNDLDSPDPLNEMFPFDEAIVETMTL